MILSKALMALALMAAPAPTATDPRIDIVGQVVDPSGIPLAKVRVVIVEIGRSTVTDGGGRFSFTEVPTGSYSLSFSLVGYSPQVRRVLTTSEREELTVVMRPTVVELPPIQVTATPKATDALRSPQPASVLTGEELKIADHTSLGATVDGLAGVHNWSTGAGIGKPVIRGLSGNRVLIASGGRRVEHQGWGDEHSPNVETVSAERIEVVRGPASVLYGSDAIGGVVNVVPRELPEALDRPGFVTGSISAGYSSNPREPEGALLLEGASGAMGFRASVAGRTSDGVRTPAGPLANSGNESLGLGGALGVRGGWGAVEVAYDRRRDKPQIHEDPAEDPDATPFQDIASDAVNSTIRLPVGYSRVEVAAGWSQNDRREFEARDEAEPALRLRERNASAGVRFQHAPIGDFVGTLGLSYRRDQLRATGEESLIPSSNADNIGLFAFEQAELGQFILGVGARYEHRSLDVFDDPALGVTAQTRSFNSLSGNIGASYLAAEGVSLVANAGSGFRAPSTFELFANGEHEGTNRFEIGNPNLANERSLNFDLALRVVTGNLQFEVGGFTNFVDNYIFPDPTSQIDSTTGLQIFLITQGDARLLGAETSLIWHVTDKLHLSGTADFVHAQNTTLNQPLPFIPPLRASYWVQYDLGQEGGTLVHPYLAIGGESHAKQTRLDPEDFAPDGYTLVHLKAGFTVAPGGGSGGVDIDIALNNALNESYTRFMSRYKTYALDMGRNLVVRATTRF